MSVSALILNALQFGLLLSLLLSLIMWVSFQISPDMWVGDYPPDIREEYGEMSQKAKRYRPLIGVLFFGAVIGVVALSFGSLEHKSPTEPGFLEYLYTGLIVLLVFNAYDLLIIDWLIFNKIQPKRIILPGTEGMAGYQDYRFHARGFLVGVVFSAVGAGVLAAAWLGVQALLGSSG
jgi:hypothetical protein